MPRMTASEKEQAIVDAVTNAPNGQLTHVQLVEALNNAGQGEAIADILKTAQRRLVNRRVVKESEGSRPVLYYTAGGEG